MSIPKDEIVVLDIAGARALVECGKSDIDTRLTQLGFTIQDDHLQRQIVDVADRVRLVNDLIKLGALFSVGPGWSPSELVDFYREQGMVTTGYRRISWSGPDQYAIENR